LGGTALGAAGGEGIGAAAGRRAGGDGGASGGQGGAAAGSTGGAGAPASAGGSANGSAGASSGPPSDPIPSEGCGSSAPADPCDTSGSPCTMDVEGTMREYYVVLPDAYEATRPYPVVFQWHPLGGNAEQGMNMYQIRPNLPDAIYVTPDGLASGGNQGFPNTNGGDEKLTRAIIAEIESKYCVDRARYFSTGFSYGSSMSYTCARNMSDVFRAVGSMAGAPISGAKCSSTPPARPVAFWGTHGTEDTALPIDLALPIRDAFIEKNGCSMTTKPVEPSPCVEYEGCSDGYPVVWCPREGDGHSIPTFSRTAIAAFFERF
jgi:poly(3-hydroxybutyrate) depolymerase